MQYAVMSMLRHATTNAGAAFNNSILYLHALRHMVPGRMKRWQHFSTHCSLCVRAHVHTTTLCLYSAITVDCSVALQERMQSSVQTPANPSYRLARLIAETTERQVGRLVLLQMRKLARWLLDFSLRLSLCLAGSKLLVSMHMTVTANGSLHSLYNACCVNRDSYTILAVI